MGGYAKILVTTDFSEQAQPGIDEAAELAKALGSEVILVYVVQDTLPPMMMSAGGTWLEAIENHRKKAEVALAECAETHFQGVKTKREARVGTPADAILAIAAEEEVDLIVMASHGYGMLGQIVLGSTTERVLKRAKCPVMVVRSSE